MSKKSNKTVKATVVVSPFDKKNAVAFGDATFSNKGGMITCIRLCSEKLQNGKDGGRTTHCVIGEAYYTFVNSSLKIVLQKDRSKNAYKSKWSDDFGSTGAAIDALVERANLKVNNDANRIKLGRALRDCVIINDSFDHDDMEYDILTYLNRSLWVAKTWNDRVVPLLK